MGWSSSWRDGKMSMSHHDKYYVFLLFSLLGWLQWWGWSCSWMEWMNRFEMKCWWCSGTLQCISFTNTPFKTKKGKFLFSNLRLNCFPEKKGKNREEISMLLLSWRSTTKLYYYLPFAIICTCILFLRQQTSNTTMLYWSIEYSQVD